MADRWVPIPLNSGFPPVWGVYLRHRPSYTKEQAIADLRMAGMHIGRDYKDPDEEAEQAEHPLGGGGRRFGLGLGDIMGGLFGRQQGPRGGGAAAGGAATAGGAAPAIGGSSGDEAPAAGGTAANVSASAAAAWQGSDGWEEVLSAGGAAKLATKLEQDNRQLLQEIRDLRADLKAAVHWCFMAVAVPVVLFAWHVAAGM